MPFIIDGTLGGTFPSWTTATRPATPTAGQEGFNNTLGVLEVYNGSAWAAAATIVPQVTRYTSGSGTYTTPTGAKYLFVRMVGGGCGGGGSGGGTGGAGGNTTFGASLTCTGGAPTVNGGSGVGGDVNITGGMGGYPITTIADTIGMMGGNSPFGGGGGVIAYRNNGQPGAANTGGGGGAGCGGSATIGGISGGAGGYLEKTISSPASTYSYAVGAGGTAGAATGDGGAGGAGGSGQIIVTAYF